MKSDMNDQEIDALVERVTRALDVPEPSPLFWDHFPARVRAAVSAGPEPAAAWWRRPVVAVSLSLALCAAIATWAIVPRTASAPGAVETAATAAPDAGDGDDAGWSLVASTAELSSVDALREAGFGVQADGADAAIEGLSQDERAAFVALLQAEMKGGGGGGL
ncbi:MAG: hypothetical protein M3Q55_13960 [Acidobacteriota bacterium]|nr:hypothetical protein [Acidobacteriota bacterium]